MPAKAQGHASRTARANMFVLQRCMNLSRQRSLDDLEQPRRNDRANRERLRKLTNVRRVYAGALQRSSTLCSIQRRRLHGPFETELMSRNASAPWPTFNATDREGF